MYDIDIHEIMATRYEIVFEKRIFFNLHNFTRIKDRNFQFGIIVEYTMVHIYYNFLVNKTSRNWLATVCVSIMFVTLF